MKFCTLSLVRREIFKTLPDTNHIELPGFTVNTVLILDQSKSHHSQKVGIRGKSARELVDWCTSLQRVPRKLKPSCYSISVVPSRPGAYARFHPTCHLTTTPSPTQPPNIMSLLCIDHVSAT